MTEFFHVAVSPLNLPFTVLLILVVLYWLIVILGAVDMDIDAEWMPDVDIDDPGLTGSLLQLLHIGDIPVMVILTLMVMIAWCFSLLANYYLNSSQSLWIAAGLLIPNAILSLFVTAFFIRIIIKIFGPLDVEDKEEQKIIYRVGVVITSEVNPTFGQVEIRTKGAPITINARTPEGSILVKGEKALVFDEDKEKGVFFVDKYD